MMQNKILSKYKQFIFNIIPVLYFSYLFAELLQPFSHIWCALPADPATVTDSNFRRPKVKHLVLICPFSNLLGHWKSSYNKIEYHLI